jgi:hypothetical protein
VCIWHGVGTWWKRRGHVAATQRVHQLRQNAAFPAPLAELRGGAVWDGGRGAQICAGVGTQARTAAGCCRMMRALSHYTCRAMWSAEDGKCVGLCAEFPSLSWLAPAGGGGDS